jgi:hypothetical protein
MKKTALVLLSTLVLAGFASAGPLVALPVSPYQVTPSPLFRDSELFFDGYGSYLHRYGNECGCGGGGSRDGFGGGFAVGHFFGYYVGARLDVNFSSVEDAQTTIGGDIIIRYPFPEAHVAPYAFVGGGVEVAEGNNGFFRVGGGLEWRITPHFGVFTEGSYAWVDQNDSAENLTVKVGIRYIY